MLIIVPAVLTVVAYILAYKAGETTFVFGCVCVAIWITFFGCMGLDIIAQELGLWTITYNNF